jgi:excisionase family DNA binding protein
VSAPQYLTVDEAAELLRMSVRAVHERTRTRSIPMRKLAATRKILFVRDELFAFMDGADLETLEKADGSIIVKPIPQEALVGA